LELVWNSLLSKIGNSYLALFEICITLIWQLHW
jgi:hypothetical protein